MSNPLLIVIPCHAGDAAQAERLMDFCYQLEGRNDDGHCLIVCAGDVHDEMKTKLRLTGSVTFRTCDLFAAPMGEHATKYQQCNHLFKHASDHVMRHYKSPWLWMEPDCVPLVPDWMGHLSDAYQMSPKRYVGPHLQFKGKDDEEKISLARVAIYPTNAAPEIAPFCVAPGPFEQPAAQYIVPRSAKSRLIQYWTYDDSTPEKVREDAVLLHSDKSGKLLEKLMKEHEPKRRGRPPKEKVEVES